MQEGFPLFKFDYPTVSEEWRCEFEDLFVERFYTREIACLPPDRWHRKLANKLRTVMPYYNRHLRAELMKFSPFLTHDMVEQGDTLENVETGKLYSSIMQAVNAERQRANGTHTTNDHEVIDTDTTGHAEGEHTKDGTVDYTRDDTTHEHTENIHEDHGDERGTHSSNENTLAEGKTTDKTTGHSQLDRTNHEVQVADGNNVYARYPQGNVDQMRPMYDGEWLTDARDVRTTTNTDGTGTETVDNNTSGNGTSEMLTDRDISGNTTGHQDTNGEWEQDTDGTLKRTDKTVSHEEGTTKDDTEGTLDTDRTLEQKHKEFSAGDKSGESKSTLSTSDVAEKTTDRNDKRHSKGFAGKGISELYQEWRDTFTNTTEEILERCEPLFWGLL